LPVKIHLRAKIANKTVELQVRWLSGHSLPPSYISAKAYTLASPQLLPAEPRPFQLISDHTVDGRVLTKRRIASPVGGLTAGIARARALF
jgi:hypothetical protein